MRRSARLGATVLAIGLALAAAGAVAQAQDTAPAAPAPGVRPVDRTILPDGTVEIRYEDGTTRRVPPAQLGTAARQEGAGNAATAAPPDADLMPVVPPEWLRDPDTLQGFRQALGEYYAYRVSGFQHRRRLFDWQLLSSKIIFVAVLVLVGSGMGFAALQFYTGFRRQLVPGAAAEEQVITQLDLSASGVKVSSPVLGVIILVISLAFFYLYLVYVYPISEIF